MNRPPLPCPVCGALIASGETGRHTDWHAHTRTLDGWTEKSLSSHFADAYDDRDDAPTITLPPIRETVGVRRRPPVPAVRELTDRAELIRAMSEELARELHDLDNDDDPAGAGE